MLLVEFHEIRTLKVRVGFDLVHGGLDLCVREAIACQEDIVVAAEEKAKINLVLKCFVIKEI